MPDVAADADPVTGMALAASEGAGKYIFFSASGTSAAGPLWAGLIALADQYARRHLGFVNPAIYRIGRSASYHQAFHDITTGHNSVRFPHETITGYQGLARLGPGNGVGNPQRAGSHPPARPLHQPLSRHRKARYCEHQIICYGMDALTAPERIDGRYRRLGIAQVRGIHLKSRYLMSSRSSPIGLSARGRTSWL